VVKVGWDILAQNRRSIGGKKRYVSLQETGALKLEPVGRGAGGQASPRMAEKRIIKSKHYGE